MIGKLMRGLVAKMSAAMAVACSMAATNVHALECADLWSFVGRACTKSVAAWDRGDNELILSGYAHHLRSTYTEEKLAELNEEAWGAGWARTVDDPDGDTHTIFFFGFRESHDKIQWNLGYLYSAMWGQKGSLRGGIGLATFLVQRPDLASGWPMPAILPVASIEYGKLTLNGTYIPTLNGGINNGSVIYVFGRYRF